MSQEEAWKIRQVLKEIARFGNPAADQSEAGQAAARRAREVLEELGLLYESDVRE